MENKQLEYQDEIMEYIEKCIEEAPTNKNDSNGIIVDGKGDEE